MSASSSVPNEHLISTESADDAIHIALCQFIGAKKWAKPYTPDEVAKALSARSSKEVTATAVASWIDASRDNRRSPRAEVLVMLFDLLGPAFTSLVLAKVGQVARSMTPDPADPGVVVASLSTGLSQFAVRAADGRFCHLDHGALEPVANEMIQILEPFSSKRGG